jgi:starch synthase/alpha-amylase
VKLQIVSVASEFRNIFMILSGFIVLDAGLPFAGLMKHLSHQAFASSDFLFMPSFEPCGLTPDDRQDFGTLPIVLIPAGC